MNRLCLIIILSLLLTSNHVYSKVSIIFSINDKSYSTIDIDNKINYFLFVSNLENNEENYNKILNQSEEKLIEDQLLNIFIDKRNIVIREEDINTTYLNLVDYISNGNEEIFIKKMNEYKISIEYLRKQITNEIIREVVKQIILKDIKIDEKITQNLNFNENIQFKINSIILSKKDIDINNFDYQKKEILKIYKNKSDFLSKLDNLKDKNYDVGFYKSKWIDLKSFDKNLKNEIINSKLLEPFIYEDEDRLYYFEIINKKFPEIDLYYSFAQINSKSLKILENLIENESICNKKNHNKLIENNKIKFIFYENKKKDNLNKEVFNKLNFEKSNLIISSGDNYSLIYVCKIEFDKDELKEYVINITYNDEISERFQELIKSLKNKYNLVIH